MKKIFTKSIACVTLIMVMFSSVFVVGSYAEENAYTVERHLDTPATFYFSELRENFGRNESVLCGYVALAMLLSYYDSYWCDRIIPDEKNFDALGNFNLSTSVVDNSPGINMNPVLDDGASYDDEINSTLTNYFLYELMRIGRDELGFTGETSSAVGSSVNGDINDEWTLTNAEEIQLLEKYLYEKVKLDNNQTLTSDYMSIQNYSVDDVTEEDLALYNTDDKNIVVRKKAIELIYQGIPLFFSGYPSDGETSQASDSSTLKSTLGHAMIAYDYDSVSDEIHFHTGWYQENFTNGYTIISENSALNKYKTDISIMWLEINEELFSHECAKNYFDKDVNQIFCMCEVYHSHLLHTTHSYSNSYDSQNHYLKCACGNKTNVHPHNFTFQYNDSATFHIEICSECEYRGVETHSYNLTYVDDTYHSLICECGQISSTEEHYHYRYEKYTTLMHKAYCECGYYFGTYHHVVPAEGIGIYKSCIYCRQIINTKEDITIRPGAVTPGIHYITKAGSYIDENGIIYLVASDMELYLDGELDVYSLVSNKEVR